MTTRRKLVVHGRGPEGCVIFYLEAYRGKVWLTSFDSPFTSEAIFEPVQADSLVDLINQTTKEARGYRPSAATGQVLISVSSRAPGLRKTGGNIPWNNDD